MLTRHKWTSGVFVRVMEEASWILWKFLWNPLRLVCGHHCDLKKAKKHRRINKPLGQQASSLGNVEGVWLLACIAPALRNSREMSSKKGPDISIILTKWNKSKLRDLTFNSRLANCLLSRVSLPCRVSIEKRWPISKRKSLRSLACLPLAVPSPIQGQSNKRSTFLALKRAKVPVKCKGRETRAGLCFFMGPGQHVYVIT